MLSVPCSFSLRRETVHAFNNARCCLNRLSAPFSAAPPTPVRFAPAYAGYAATANAAPADAAPALRDSSK